eukprot:COSAG05_NODE_1120_length_5815_cov_444.390483_3_plen_354_part_00
MENPKLLHSILEALLKELGYVGAPKDVDEILPQLHQQSRQRLESTEAKARKLSAHLEDLSTTTAAIADEVSNIQESVSGKFRELHRLLDEKEAKFKQDVAEVATQVGSQISEQEEQCQGVMDALQNEAAQLQSALRQDNELGFISGIANMPKHELEIDTALLKVPALNFTARATLNSEPIAQMIQELSFNVQPVRPAPAIRQPEYTQSTPSLSGATFTPNVSTFSSPRTSSREVAPSKELFIGGLPLDATDSDVRPLFAKHGAIKNLDMSNVTKGFAFLEFEDVDSAKKAVGEPGITLQRRHLNVPSYYFWSACLSSNILTECFAYSFDLKYCLIAFCGMCRYVTSYRGGGRS